MDFEPFIPKVFISYSHDSQEHKDRVLSLADRLRRDGIDCNIDQYEESPAQGWPRWMLNQLEWADFVLVVSTERYNLRFLGKEKPGQGKGVTWEGAVIYQELYDAQGNSSKFIPVIFSTEDGDHVPIIIRGFSRYQLDSDAGYENLYRRLTNQPDTPKPKLGKLKELPSRDRQQFFFTEEKHTRLKQEFVSASKGLLNWENTLHNNLKIVRPELKELLDLIEAKKSSTTIVLGSQGTGKSILLSTLGHELVKRGYSILAIKADFLSNQVDNLEKLQHDEQLCLSLNPKDAVKAVSNEEKVILLIDQLDAVSELLDRHSGRLNVLLNLIQSLSGIKNIHIVGTCREFEFRHGSQFSRLEGFEQLNLSLPTWELISPILKQIGHNPDGMGESLRALLRTPLHLKIFFEVANPGEVFDSSQKLLDKLWQSRILERPNAKNLIVFLENLANRMTKEEVLWLPISVADYDHEIRLMLERDGILIFNPENSTFGFCHQSYYDYTLARGFARGSQSLIDLVLERQDGLFVRPILLRGLNYLRGTAIKQYRYQIRILLQNVEVNRYRLKNKMARLFFFTINKLPGKLRNWGFKLLQYLKLIYIRTHIYRLLIEFIGAQREPDAVEVEYIFPLIKSEIEGPRIIDAMIGNPNWFVHLYNCEEFREWMEKETGQAIYCRPLLLAASQFNPEKVWNLLEEYWLENSDYDELSISILITMKEWNIGRIWSVKQLVRRSNIDWHSVSLISGRVAGKFPEQVSEIIRAYLDRKLDQTVEVG